MQMINREEKKVEYLELIYDLIFVYMIGRNNSLLHHVEGGFVSGEVFAAYILCSLAIIQIWNFSTFYTNMYGRNSVRDHVFMFLNMYLLYYMGEGIRLHWENYQVQFNIAWALILMNIGIQYAIELRNHKGEPGAEKTIRGLMTALFGETAVVLISIPVYERTGVSIAGLAVLSGIILTWKCSGKEKASAIDFAHLSERAMLYVVFTFGEMIIAIAGYFEDRVDFSMIYFSAMCFLIAAGLFLSYELFYNRIIDRDRPTSGMGYMMIHIFLVFSMNTLTASLEFMHDPQISLWPKTVFLILSFLLFFGCMFALLGFAKPQMRTCRHLTIPTAVLSGVFVVLMILLCGSMYANILVSVLYVYIIFLLLYRFSRQRT